MLNFVELIAPLSLPQEIMLAPRNTPPGAKRGVFYRPVKQQLTLRLDADVISWFRSHATSAEGYQTRINRALREYMQAHARRNQRSVRA
jgi:uncharacterized protein (DUF4415 family)